MEVQCNLKLKGAKDDGGDANLLVQKGKGFENYTFPRFTTVNPNVPTTFFGYHCLGQVFDFIPWDIIRDSKSVSKSPETR